MIPLPRGEEKVAPGLLPLLDILFTLLLFILMGGQFGPREQKDLRLPQADRLGECSTYLPRTPVTVNVYHRPGIDCDRYRSCGPCPEEQDHWRVNVRGRECPDRDSLCRLIRTSRRVLLRADAAAPYGLVQRTLAACAAEGISSISLNARRAPAIR